MELPELPKELKESDLEGLGRAELVTVILAQNKVNLALEKRISDLEKQLGLNGPEPPLAGFKRNKPKRERKKRKPRASNFSRRRETPTHVVDHFPDTCPDCGRGLQGGCPDKRRQVIDIEPNPVKVTEHVLHVCWCGVCGKRVRARVDFSALVHGKRRIGHNLASWIANLHISARVPLDTIQTILKQLYSVHISTGEMSDLMSLIAKKGETALEDIKEEIHSSDCVHADETGWRENGQYKCLWSLSTKQSRWFHIDARRSSEVALGLIGSAFSGTLVTDFYAAYNQIPGRHQRCWPHFQRALEKLRLHPLVDKSLEEWIDAVLNIWYEGRDYRAFCLQQPRFGASVFDRKRKRRELEQKLYALAEPFLDADSALVPQATLARRIGIFLSELFTFVEYPEVPDDNNAAERAIRPAVVIRKVCGGTRSEKGTNTKAILMSLFGTWKVQAKDPIQECKALLATP